MLMKRGRDNGQFLSRRFVLSEREGTLKYFTKYDVSGCCSRVPTLAYLLLLWAEPGLASTHRTTHFTTSA